MSDGWTPRAAWQAASVGLLLSLASCSTAPTVVSASPPLSLGAIPDGPEGDAFYLPPSPLPPGRNGDVIWARPFSGAGALPSAAHNLLVLYRTTSVVGAPVAVSGAVAFPRGLPPAGGWPVLSWAHGTTGNAPQCAPTREISANLEQRLLDEWVARGYVVLQTDYEGEGTPEVHPYLVGVAAGRDLTDLVRAARALDPQVGPRWVAMGHSEGGHAALFAAALAPTWAPDLNLLGTVAMAPVSHITAALLGTVQARGPVGYLPFTALMIQGMATADPELHLDRILSAQGLALLPELQRKCVGELVEEDAWTSIPASSFFKANPELPRLEHDFLANEPGTLHLTAPVLLVQGESDTLVNPAATVALGGDLCQRGASVQYRSFPGEEHDSVLEASLRSTEQWVDARFRGESISSSCR